MFEILYDDGRQTTMDGRRTISILKAFLGAFGSGELKRGNTLFQIITLSVAMETSCWIWRNFVLIQASMHVLITCKYENDQMKNSGENVMMSFFSIISLTDFFQMLKGSQLRSPWSDLAEFRTHSSSYVCHHYLQV